MEGRQARPGRAVIMPWWAKPLAVLLLLAATWGHGWMRGASHGEAKLAAFAADVRTEGVKAQAVADARADRDRQRKAASDASYEKALVVLGADIERMRRARAGSNPVPAAPAGSRCPEGWACFDRAELEQAIRRLDADVSGIVAEGDSIALKLDTAIRWAAELK